MELRIKISFIIGLVLINLSCSSIALVDEKTKMKLEAIAETRAKLLDYAIGDIPSDDKRSCVRATFVDAYFEKLFCENQKLVCENQCAAHLQKLDYLTQEIVNLFKQNEKLQADNNKLQADNTYLNNTLNTCMKCLQKLSVRRYLEVLEKMAFPPWLFNSDMDRYEKWLFASHFVKGVNMNQVRKFWEEELRRSNKNCTYEDLAGAMLSLYESISDAVAHGESELEKTPTPDEMKTACERVAGVDEKKQLVCQTVWSIKVDSSANAAKDAPTDKHCIYYGKILPKNINLAIERLQQLFPHSEPGDSDDVSFCQLDCKIIDHSKYPLGHKKAGMKNDFIGFRAVCPKTIIPDEFKTYVLGKEEKKQPRSGGLAQDKDNENVVMALYIDPNNPPRYLTTTTMITTTTTTPIQSTEV